MNQKTHPIQTSHLILLTLTFVLSSNQYGQHSQYSDLDIRWKFWVQILAGARELSLLQKLQTSSSAHPASNSMKSTAFSGSTVATAHSLTTHNCLSQSLKISASTPPLNLSPSMAHIGTLFYCTPYTCTYISRGHIHSVL